ncbi:LacI family transcriptional regulator [Bifidobacterium goeldii]|uniref:LacI family transcriptional regulator n=1 Tax=Bifidobacterium goeldii TaxID=2306975 RepID=A0A430FFX5_9BIFI|nr:LacI family DNA-binding transcriptional regulator [Bifidobacterium goeldii]RSX51720.1 LacI family transcriptional regulator [Bifidobacterium goeldii]
MARTTIADVAQAAGVSVSTVSRALRGLDKVNPETRERIREQAERLHFSFSKSASSLASGKTMRVAVLLPNEINSWFNANVFEGIYEVLSGKGYDVIPYVMLDEPSLERFFSNLPGNRNVDAVFVCSFDLDDAQRSVLTDFTLPVVGINTPSDHGYDAVARIDDHAAMADAVRLLHSLGHECLAYVAQPVNPSPFTCSDVMRMKGFLDATKACGYDDERIVMIPSLRSIDTRSIQDAYSGIAAQLLSAPIRPTGICVSPDSTAVPLIKELRRIGWQVPQDVSVIGFDDDTTAAAIDLTTIHQNPVQTGREAARMALALMNGEELDEPYVDMPTTMVMRGTTGPAPSMN